MENIKEILNNIKDRLSNPLIFSFLLSWLIYNWEITVALVWYDKSQISAEGCKSIFEFIQYKLDNRYGSTFLPVIIAFIYTLGFPYLKYVINILNSKALEWGKKNEIKFLKEVTSLEIENLKVNLKDSNNRNIELDIINNEIRKEIDDVSFLNGYWKVTYVFNQNDPKEKVTIIENVEIINGKYQVISENRVDYKYSIRNFYLNKNGGTVFFIKYLKSEYFTNINLIDEDYRRICELRIDNIDRFFGEENRYVSVVFERMSKKTIEDKM